MCFEQRCVICFSTWLFLLPGKCTYSLRWHNAWIVFAIIIIIIILKFENPIKVQKLTINSACFKICYRSKKHRGEERQWLLVYGICNKCFPLCDMFWIELFFRKKWLPCLRREVRERSPRLGIFTLTIVHAQVNWIWKRDTFTGEKQASLLNWLFSWLGCLERSQSKWRRILIIITFFCTVGNDNCNKKECLTITINIKLSFVRCFCFIFSFTFFLYHAMQ